MSKVFFDKIQVGVNSEGCDDVKGRRWQAGKQARRKLCRAPCSDNKHYNLC